MMARTAASSRKSARRTSSASLAPAGTGSGAWVWRMMAWLDPITGYQGIGCGEAEQVPGKMPNSAKKGPDAGAPCPASGIRRWRGLLRRDHHDFDAILRRRQPGLDGSAGRGISGRYPAVPHRVHFREVFHVGDVDRRRQQLRLVAAG